MQNQTAAAPFRATVLLDSVDACKADQDTVRVDMHLRLRLQNTGANPLIVAKGWSEGGWRILTPDVDRSSNQGWVSLDYFGSSTPPQLPQIGGRPGADFRILKPGDTFTVPVKASIFPIGVDYAAPFAIQLALRNLVFSDWTEKDIQDATRKWASSGHLVLGANTEPFSVSVDTTREVKGCSEP